jgi:hypothetical protein
MPCASAPDGASGTAVCDSALGNVSLCNNLNCPLDGAVRLIIPHVLFV